jgi:hypothetical protein
LPSSSDCHENQVSHPPSPTPALAAVQTTQVKVTVDVRVSVPVSLRLRFLRQTMHRLRADVQFVFEFQDLGVAGFLDGIRDVGFAAVVVLVKYLLSQLSFGVESVTAGLADGGVLVVGTGLRLEIYFFLEMVVDKPADESKTRTLFLLLLHLLCLHPFLAVEMAL